VVVTADVQRVAVVATLAKAGEENFPVAMRLLPRRHRRHLMAVYLFARTVDDIGDRASPPDRLRLLADLEADVRRLYGASADPSASADPKAYADLAVGITDLAVGTADPADRLVTEPAVRGLAETVRECGIPAQPFLDLIEANRQDQVVSRYQTFDDLLGYCRLSANPVGRIVLHIFGNFTPARAELSDLVCTALQLAEHWQDVAEDLGSGRIYVPIEDLRRHGCDEQDLAAPHASPAVRRLMEFEVRRAGSMIDAGAPLIGTLRGSARAAVAGYVAGGRAALAAIEAADYDVLAATPRPSKLRTATGLAMAWARAR
jgi:squalene synthase HpnC